MSRFLAITDSSKIKSLLACGELYLSPRELVEIYSADPYTADYQNLLEDNFNFKKVTDKIFLLISQKEERETDTGMDVCISEIEYIIALNHHAADLLQSKYPILKFNYLNKKYGILKNFINFVIRRDCSSGIAVMRILFGLTELPVTLNSYNLLDLSTQPDRELLVAKHLINQRISYYQTGLTYRTMLTLVTMYNRTMNYPKEDMGYVFDMLEIFHYVIDRSDRNPPSAGSSWLKHPIYSSLIRIYEEKPDMVLEEILFKLKSMPVAEKFLHTVSVLSGGRIDLIFIYLKAKKLIDTAKMSRSVIAGFATMCKDTDERELLASWLGCCLGYSRISSRLYASMDLCIMKDPDYTGDLNENADDTDNPIKSFLPHRPEVLSGDNGNRSGSEDTVLSSQLINDIPEDTVKTETETLTPVSQDATGTGIPGINGSEMLTMNIKNRAANDDPEVNIGSIYTDTPVDSTSQIQRFNTVTDMSITDLDNYIGNNPLTDNPDGLDNESAPLDKDDPAVSALDLSNISFTTNEPRNGDIGISHILPDGFFDNYFATDTPSQVPENNESEGDRFELIDLMEYSSVNNEADSRNNEGDSSEDESATKAQLTGYRCAYLNGIIQALTIKPNFLALGDDEIFCAVKSLITTEAPVSKDMIIKRFAGICRQTGTHFRQEQKMKLRQELTHVIEQLHCETDEENFIYCDNSPVNVRRRSTDSLIYDNNMPLPREIRYSSSVSSQEISAAVKMLMSDGNLGLGGIKLKPEDINRYMGLLKNPNKAEHQKETERLKKLIDRETDNEVQEAS